MIRKKKKKFKLWYALSMFSYTELICDIVKSPWKCDISTLFINSVYRIFFSRNFMFVSINLNGYLYLKYNFILNYNLIWSSKTNKNKTCDLW